MREYHPDRWYQTEAIQAPIDYFMSGNTGNPVIALPTGTGKARVNAGIVEKVIKGWSGQRIMCLTHVKELIEQNVEDLQDRWPTAPMGVYSAGLNQKDTAMPIIFGGVGSVANAVERFGHRDLVIVDECHLIPPKADTTYMNVLSQMREINPYLKVIGLTATPYRLGQGMITDGGIFTDICYDKTGVEDFNRFIAEGHLVPLYPRRTKVERQSNVNQRGSNGDFSAASLAADAEDKAVTYQALVEMCEIGQDRNSWLIFSSTIDDAEFIAATLNSFGISAAAVHSKKPRKECDKLIEQYKLGLIRCLVNQDMLTTGFNHRPLDLIGMLRRTMSPGLWVQMLGRGTRPSPETGKTDCLVLDFAGNTRRLGPINDPRIPKKKGKGGGDAPVRICEACGTYNYAAARKCDFCGEEFTFQTHIVASAATEELIRSDIPVIEYFDVNQVFYYLHEKPGKPKQMKVVYQCNGGMQKFNEFVQFEHSGFNRQRAKAWWQQRFPGDFVPDTTSEALQLLPQLRVPNRIKVWVNKAWPEVLNYEY